ncbi:VIT1/CCC1 transporter family protein [Flavobacterium sp. GT3R68]|uniref:VIT1/CCC1 transporter family protein n=1 Tax=Flavobacterium sp. GT3R68 TaxID=2594437 RepID=UPI000F8954F6|nr:VIT1/CCC1 transporter family protein [Flavobacterium sp. GT3R68]RTY93676.1 rubrerythrin family protein [Flavobacterium sp. GSN2]TRW91602.1 rubrerythrin family protein [Flavobacterium sp. GT3R68]
MDIGKMKSQIQVEVDTAFLYASIAAIQEDSSMRQILQAMAEIEKGHASRFLIMIRVKDPDFQLPGVSQRAKLQFYLGKFFGYSAIISGLADIEKQMAKVAVQNKLKTGEKVSGFEHNHLKIIESLNYNKAFNVSGGIFSKLESRHKTVGGNALRAAVLGANDGLVSNMSLVMGVAGASLANNTILLTGIAGLLAGAISMSLGEWLSVQSSRELHLRQIELELEELESSPEEEKQELTLLYQAKGMDYEAAVQLAEKAFENPETAIEALISEELGINKDELGGSAWEAALTSFFLFAFGAIIPVYPYMFLKGMNAVYLSLGSSVVGLFCIGAAITLFTGKSIWFSGIRQVFFGLTAAAVTYGIGSLIGVSLMR